MDISRVLLKDPTAMAPYDVPSSVIDKLRSKNVNTIHLVGRRGLIQSSFTIKEIREVSRIKDVKLYALKDEVEASLNEESMRETQADFSVHARGILRRSEFL